jgi:outer membrane receptor protein involved in Fe transport
MGLRARPEPVINGKSVDVTLDSVDMTNDVTGGTLLTPPVSALDELNIVTSGVRAEQGRSIDASVRLVTKAGSNAWHGSASFFHRGSQWSALPATFERGGDVPSFGRSQYSGALGGPIVRDHFFWFGSFEYSRQRSPLQAGERDLDARTIRNKLSVAPLTSTLGLLRADWSLSDRDRLAMLYSGERSDGSDLPALQRPLASASQRQRFNEEFDQGMLNYTRSVSPTLVAEARLSFGELRAASEAGTSGFQLNFPDLQSGAPFRAPALPRHDRLQLSGVLAKVAGPHVFKFGGETQRISAEYAPGFGSGSIEFAENFASADRNGDGRVDDGDLLAGVTLLNVSPQQNNAYLRNTHVAAFAQDDWRVRRNLTLNLGARWQFDTNEKNLGGYDNINPLVRGFLRGARERDKNNFAPRVGFARSFNDERFVLRGGYSLLFDRIPLQYAALEQTLDGRHTIVAAVGGNVWPNAPGINILDNSLQNPMTQQASLELQWLISNNLAASAGYLRNAGSHIMLGRSLGAVFNPLTGGLDRVVNLESSGKTKYDALNLSVERRFSQKWELFANYTLSKSFNYANGDQLPFFNGMADPGSPRLEYGPSPFDRRHRFSMSGQYEFPLDIRAAAVWTMATGAPMDILLPDASARLPFLQRNAGGRLFRKADELNRFITSLNAAGGVNGAPLPLAGANARFNDGFQNLDLRLTKRFQFGGDARLELGGEFFNLFNVTNVLGWSNYSGFANALARDGQSATDPGFLKSSGFGRPLTTAGRLFTGGGPRSFQFVAKFSF